MAMSAGDELIFVVSRAFRTRQARHNGLKNHGGVIYSTRIKGAGVAKMNLTVTKRFDLNMGRRCNLQCKFCYYLQEIQGGNTHDMPTEQVKKVLDIGIKRGKRRVDLTGGEPTVRRDLTEIIAYARGIGYTTVCIITNGLVVSRRKKLQEYVDAGLNDILLSVHAYNAGLHDELVGLDGAHQKVMKALEHARDLGITTRVNHVVSNLNYQDVLKMADLLVDYGPDALNFIIFNPTRNAINAFEALSLAYQDFSPYLLEMLQAHHDMFPALNLRHIPFCYVKGFERNVKTMYQLQYEKVEWDYTMDILYKRGRAFLYASTLFGAALMLFNPRFYQLSWDVKLKEALQRARIFNDRHQGAKCKSCKLRYVCDGLPKEYVRHKGADQVSPYLEGPLIYDPTHFIPRSEIEDL